MFKQANTNTRKGKGKGKRISHETNLVSENARAVYTPKVQEKQLPSLKSKPKWLKNLPHGDLGKPAISFPEPSSRWITKEALGCTIAVVSYVADMSSDVM